MISKFIRFGLVLMMFGGVTSLVWLNVLPREVLDWWPIVLIGRGLWGVTYAIARSSKQLVGALAMSSLGGHLLLRNLSLQGFAMDLLLVLAAVLIVGRVLGIEKRTALASEYVKVF